MFRLIVVLSILAAAVACSKTEAADKAPTPVGKIGNQALHRYGPDDLGVVCYNISTSSNNLSCVYVGVEEKQ